jgi:hypothetical protein
MSKQSGVKTINRRIRQSPAIGISSAPPRTPKRGGRRIHAFDGERIEVVSAVNRIPASKTITAGGDFVGSLEGVTNLKCRCTQFPSRMDRVRSEA